MSWAVVSRDYRSHKFGDPKPPTVRTYHATQEEAEAVMHTIRATATNVDFVLSVVKTRRREPTPQMDFGFASAAGPRRLTV